MRIALIAHDEKKPLINQLAIAYQPILAQHELFATGHTGEQIHHSTGLPVTCFNSGPLGGDQEVGALIAKNQLDLVIFLRDPLTAQPHEPDVNALIRLCDVYNVPLATNIGSAEVLLRGLDQGFINFRSMINGDTSQHDAY